MHATTTVVNFQMKGPNMASQRTGKTCAVVASLAIAAAAVIAPAGAASASTDACPVETLYAITSNTSYHMRGTGLPIFKDGPGGTMTGSVSAATSVSATMTVGASVELGNVIARAKVQVSASLTASVGITIGHSYTHTITAGKYGNMQYGSWGQQVNWTKYQDNANCTTTTLATGTARIPSTSVGWKYWETTS